MTRNRQDVLGDLIADMMATKTGGVIGAEIGVGSGPTTDALMKRFPTGLEWVAVDSWPAGFALHPPSRGVMTAERQVEVREAFFRVMRRHGSSLVLVEQPSIEAAALMRDGVFDLVFIDADHSYEACKADILAWRPKVRPGGWLAGHDYFPEAFPGVVQAVDELVPDRTLDVDHVWMVRV